MAMQRTAPEVRIPTTHQHGIAIESAPPPIGRRSQARLLADAGLSPRLVAGADVTLDVPIAVFDTAVRNLARGLAAEHVGGALRAEVGDGPVRLEVGGADVVAETDAAKLAPPAPPVGRTGPRRPARAAPRLAPDAGLQRARRDRAPASRAGAPRTRRPESIVRAERGCASLNGNLSLV
jgi:hypothetical protein